MRRLRDSASPALPAAPSGRTPASPLRPRRRPPPASRPAAFAAVVAVAALGRASAAFLAPRPGGRAARVAPRGLEAKTADAASDAEAARRLKEKIEEATTEGAVPLLNRKMDEAEEEGGGDSARTPLYGLPGRKNKAYDKARPGPEPVDFASTEPTMHLSSLGRLEIASNASLPFFATLILEGGDEEAVNEEAVDEEAVPSDGVANVSGIVAAVKDVYDEEIKNLQEEMAEAYRRRSNEMALAFAEYMVKSHEEKLRVVAALKREHAAEIRALRREIRSLTAAATSREASLARAEEEAASARRALESGGLEAKEERDAAVAEAERRAAERYEALLRAERKEASRAIAEAERRITEKYEKLLEDREAAAVAAPPPPPPPPPSTRTVEEFLGSQKRQEGISGSSPPKQWWE